MAEELPPAVARFIADVTQYTEPLQRAIEDTKKLQDRTDMAAVKARELGLSAREGADKAAAAMRLAEEAAGRFERGEISLAEATHFATEAAKAQARADVQLAVAQEAVTKALKQQEDQEKKTKDATQKAGFAEMGMLQKIWAIAGFATGSLEPLAAGIIAILGGLSSGIASAAMGLGAFGIVAKSVLTSSVASATAAKAAQDQYTAAISRAQHSYAQSMATANKAAARHNALLTEQKAIQNATIARTNALNKAYQGLSQSQIQLGKGILNVKDQWHAFIAAVAPGVADVLNSGLKLVPQFLQYLGMFLPPVEVGLKKVIDLISKGTNTTWFISFMQTMSANSGQSIEKIAVAVGHLFKGLAGLLVAFAPFAQVVLKGLDQMTGKFAAWGQGLSATKGFGEFMTMVKTQGPTIVTTLKNIGTVATALVKDMTGSASNMIWLKLVPGITGMAAAFAKANPGLIEWAFNIMLVTSTMKQGFGVIGKGVTTLTDLGKSVSTAVGNTRKLVQGFNDAEAAASEASGSWGTFGGKLKTVMSGGLFSNFIKGFKDADAAASEATGKVGTFGGKVRSVFSAVQAASMAPVKGLSNFAKGFKNAEVAASDASGMMGTFGGNVKGVFSAIKAGGATAFSALSSGVSTAVTAVAALPGILSSAAAAVKSWAIWSKVAAAATKVWTAIQIVFDAVMAANPIVLIILGIMALVAVVILCYTHFKVFREIVDKIGQFLKSFFVGALHLVEEAVKKTIEFIKSHWPLLLAIITGPIGLAVYFIVKYWNTIYGFIKGIVVDVINFIKNHWQLILGILGGPFGMAVYLITKYWNDIVHAVMTGVDWVLRILESLPSKTLAMFRGIGSLLLQAGKDLVMGFINGIESMFGMVVATARTLISSLGGTVLKVLGIGSPSKVAMWWGKMTGHGMAQGLLSQVGNVQNAAQQMALAANTGMSTIGMRNVLPGGILRTTAPSAAAASGGGGNLDVYVDGQKLFSIMKSQLYKYNIRNSGQVTGIVKPA